MHELTCIRNCPVGYFKLRLRNINACTYHEAFVDFYGISFHDYCNRTNSSSLFNC